MIFISNLYLHPDRVFWFDSRFEGHCLVVHCLHEEIVNKLLFSFVWDMFEQSIHRDHLAPGLSTVRKIKRQTYFIFRFRPLLIGLANLEDLLLLLGDDLEGVDEGGAPVERVPGHQHEGGLGEFDPLAVNELLQVKGGLR